MSDYALNRCACSVPCGRSALLNLSVAKSVHTPVGSTTSFCLAMVAVGSALMTQVIFTGHLFNHHVLEVHLPCIFVREGCVCVCVCVCVFGHWSFQISDLKFSGQPGPTNQPTKTGTFHHHRATPISGQYEMPS